MSQGSLSQVYRPANPRRSARTRAEFLKLFDSRVRTLLRGDIVLAAPNRRNEIDRVVLLPGGRVYLVEIRHQPPWDLHPAPIGLEAASRFAIPVHRLLGAAGIRRWLSERVEETRQLNLKLEPASISKQRIQVYR